MGRFMGILRTMMLPALASCALAACDKQDSGAGTGAAPPAAKRVKIGYVLHGLDEFPKVIQKGASDAGKAMDVDVQVVGPAGFVTAEARAMFEGMVQKRVHGLVVVPMPGDVWVRPIKDATDAKIPVLTANVASLDSASPTWFGQDEHGSGVVLATELRKLLDAAGKKDGKILVGICAPGVDVLVRRYEGFKKGMEGTAFQISQPYDVAVENTKNYGAWENLAGANADAVAIVGLCSMDLPNLAKLKARTKATWIAAGYDLNVQTLDAIKAGTVQLTLGQHPYLQGYLPVIALARHLRDNKPLPQGWIDTGTEVVTKENVESLYQREADEAAETKWYADYIQKHFADLQATAKPMPKR